MQEIKKYKNKIFFVHIPKTAGTSFRKGLEAFFGTDNVMYDYSLRSSETSEPILNYFYTEDADSYRFFKETDTICAIAGHVNILKYLPFCGTSQIITFMRDPALQIISHYNHFVTYNNYKDSFQTFVKNPGMHNCQSRKLYGVPLELIGFVGISEHYDQSIQLINHEYQLNLPILRLNEKQSDILIDSEAKGQIEDLALADRQLYNKAKRIFEERHRLFIMGQSWAYALSNITNNNVVHGIAYFKNSDEPVYLDIYLDGEQIGTTKACLFAKNWSYLQLPRNSFVGYQFILPKGTKAHQDVTIRVKQTEQLITYSHLKTRDSKTLVKT